MDNQRQIVIIGSGISGLATAYYLQKAARDQQGRLQVHIVERREQAGGVISTVRDDGFIVEGGPDSMLSYKPAGLRLLHELGLDDEIVGTSNEQKGSFVYSRGRLHPLPEGLTLMIPSKLGPLFRTQLITWPGKLRAGLDLFWSRRTDGEDVSVADFIEMHLGKEVFERIVEPLFAGIYAGDARQLSLPATYPQLLTLEGEYGSLLRGLLVMRRQRRHGASPRWTPFITLRTGLVRLVEALTAQLTDTTFHFGSAVMALERGERNGDCAGRKWSVRLQNGETLSADVVVLAAPAHTAATLLRSLDHDLADALAATPYVSSATVSFAFRREEVNHPLRGFGFVVPRVEDRPLLACTWTSNKFPHRARPGYALFRCFLGRAGQEAAADLPEAELIALTRREIKATMGVDAVPTHAWVFRWQRALPQYTVGHLARLALIDDRMASWPGLYLAGNAYRGVGIPDCIQAGARVAEQIMTNEMES